jgi:exodeoxyribonuclease VII large subunit
MSAPEFPDQGPRVWGVRELINYLGRTLSRDDRLQFIGVRGEVAGFKQPGYGYAYFRLREPSGAVLECFVGSSAVRELPVLDDGKEAIAYGSVGVHRDRSVFQLYVTSVHLVGAGKDAEKYERIKRKLQEEGLFDPARRRPIPRFPFRIALVSALTADGARDFMETVRRAPAVRARLFETIVQGTNAADSIASALGVAARSRPDVVVLARGGGSDEDRLPFNEEVVARAISCSPVPVVTAIGHFGDHHIADDVADHASGTPTAAANMLVAGFLSVEPLLGDLAAKLRSAVSRGLVERRTAVLHLAKSPSLQRFDRVTAALAQRVDGLAGAVQARHRLAVHGRADRVRSLERRLAPFDPGALLAERRTRLRGLAAALEPRWSARCRSLERDARDADGGLQRAIGAYIERSRTRNVVLRARLNGKDPEAILQQGYSIVRIGDRVVRDALSVRVGDLVEAQLSRGTIRARVEQAGIDG